MIETLAVVVKIDAHQVLVESQPQSACGGCQQQSSCSTHAIGSALKTKTFAVESDIPLQVGDAVVIAMDETSLLRAAFIQYALPLVALLLGAGSADSGLPKDLAYRELWVVGAAVVGFVLALGLIKKYQQLLMPSLSPSARPRVVSKR